MIKYKKGKPTEIGMYACVVPNDDAPGWTEDKFLMWFDGRWCYPGSDQFCRKKVLGWIGPLQRGLK